MECRIHLNLLRSAGFYDLLKVLNDFVQTEGPVENVCISFLFRKVSTEDEVRPWGHLMETLVFFGF